MGTVPISSHSALESSWCGKVGLQSSAGGFPQSCARGQDTAAETRVSPAAWPGLSGGRFVGMLCSAWGQKRIEGLPGELLQTRSREGEQEKPRCPEHPAHEQSHCHPRPSASWGGRRSKCGGSEAVRGCLLEVRGGWRRDGWMLLCVSVQVQPLLSQTHCCHTSGYTSTLAWVWL